MAKLAWARCPDVPRSGRRYIVFGQRRTKKSKISFVKSFANYFGINCKLHKYRDKLYFLKENVYKFKLDAYLKI